MVSTQKVSKLLKIAVLTTPLSFEATHYETPTSALYRLKVESHGYIFAADSM